MTHDGYRGREDPESVVTSCKTVDLEEYLPLTVVRGREAGAFFGGATAEAVSEW